MDDNVSRQRERESVPQCDFAGSLAAVVPSCVRNRCLLVRKLVILCTHLKNVAVATRTPGSFLLAGLKSLTHKFFPEEANSRLYLRNLMTYNSSDLPKTTKPQNYEKQLRFRLLTKYCFVKGKFRVKMQLRLDLIGSGLKVLHSYSNLVIRGPKTKQISVSS